MTAAKTSGRHLAVEEGHRRSELAAIPTGAKALGLDDSLYRDLLERVTGARSAAGLDGERRRAVLDEMRRLGFEKTAGKRAGRARLADSAQARLIRALWLELRDLGVLRDSSEHALCRFSERVSGIRELSWLDQAHAAVVIGALQGWRDRVAAERRGEA
ncbi:MAG: regulatory protein GemA [Candidatus Binataceae bacterium]